MIDYHRFCQIKHLHEHQGLNASQIARELSLDPRTVSYWLAQAHFCPRKPRQRLAVPSTQKAPDLPASPSPPSIGRGSQGPRPHAACSLSGSHPMQRDRPPLVRRFHNENALLA